MSLARTSGAPEPVAPDPGEPVGQLAHCSARPASQSVAVLLVQVLGPARERYRSYELTFMMWGGGVRPISHPIFQGSHSGTIRPLSRKRRAYSRCNASQMASGR